MTNKHIVLFSGGEGSALVAIEVARRYGTENLILLNHDICSRVEEQDIKRFKEEVATYLGVPITYANMSDWETKDQFDVVIEAGAFKVRNGTALCTNRLKTAPFDQWLKEHKPDQSCVFYYGFDQYEQKRILRRSSIMAAKGHRTDFPLAFWHRTIATTREVGIEPPLAYNVFKHANCTGCLKAGMQHWYCVFCLRPDLWEKAKYAEDVIGYSIIKGVYLDELECKFRQMRAAGIEPTERIPAGTFWAQARKFLGDVEETSLPCECAA